MKLIMKLILISLMLAGFSCWPRIPGCEAKKTQAERDKCTMEAAAILALLAPKPARESSGSARVQTVNFMQESAYTSNDTFVLAHSLPLPDAYTVQAISGKINTEGDVDIYSVSYTSGTALAFVLDVSKPGTAALCSLYSSFGPSASTSGVPDGSMVNAGTVSANVTTVALDRVSHTHLYIRCSGLSGEMYTVRLAYSALN